MALGEELDGGRWLASSTMNTARSACLPGEVPVVMLWRCQCHDVQGKSSWKESSSRNLAFTTWHHGHASAHLVIVDVELLAEVAADP